MVVLLYLASFSALLTISAGERFAFSHDYSDDYFSDVGSGQPVNYSNSSCEVQLKAPISTNVVVTG